MGGYYVTMEKYKPRGMCRIIFCVVINFWVNAEQIINIYWGGKNIYKECIIDESIKIY